MTPNNVTDWNPEAYSRFRGLRLRPALDLLAQVGDLPLGDIIDLGCGNGAVGPALRHRFADRQIIGVDQSPQMLGKAKAEGHYDRVVEADIAHWLPETPPALIFSNAALHWLPDHAALMPRLAGVLAKGGMLAVQMPRQYGAPSHRFLREIAQAMYPDRFDFVGHDAPVAQAMAYHELLAPFGAVVAWETEFVQVLAASAEGHPVRRFTESTAMRPFLERMTESDAAAFVARYDAALELSYPRAPDGTVLFPFRRCFFTLKV